MYKKIKCKKVKMYKYVPLYICGKCINVHIKEYTNILCRSIIFQYTYLRNNFESFILIRHTHNIKYQAYPPTYEFSFFSFKFNFVRVPHFDYANTSKFLKFLNLNSLKDRRKSFYYYF